MMKEFHFIDMHSHILPNVDDGAKNIEETRKMLQMAYDDGVREMVATPHFTTGRYYKKNNLLQAYELVKEEALKISNDFKIYLGNELYYSSGIVDALRNHSANTIADSKYVLVEFSQNDSFRRINEGIRELILSGYLPILAHVERFRNLSELKRIEELIDAGCYIQVNATSFIGGFFDQQARFCKKILQYGYVHFVGSDCHNTEDRKPVMQEAYKKISKILETDRLNDIFFINPRKVIDNQII